MTSSKYNKSSFTCATTLSSTDLLHEDIIRELDTSAKLFNVLVIKTDLAIPYTSVFFQLECGYWNANAEKNMRQQLESANSEIPILGFFKLKENFLFEELFLEKATIQHHGTGQVMIAPNNWLDARINNTGNLYLLEKPEGRVVKNQGNGGRIIEQY